MIHIGIHTDNWRPLSVGFEAACQKIAQTGIKHIEFCAIDGQNFIAALGYDPGVSLESNPRAIRRSLEKLGLKVSQIDGSYPMMGPNGSAYGIRYVTQTIRLASELGCPMVDTVDGAFETPGLTRKEVFRVTCDNYRQCLTWAEDYKVIINVEPHGPYTNDIEFMQNLFNHFESEYLRCNFDTGNTFIAGHEPLEYLKALKKYVVHCHIKDVSPALAAAVRGEETGIGSSEVFVGGGVNAENIRCCMEFLHGQNWDGVVSLECSGTDENTRKSVEWMTGVVKALTKPKNRNLGTAASRRASAHA
jgi:sugar phosphate isomerase/epimerase